MKVFMMLEILYNSYGIKSVFVIGVICGIGWVIVDELGCDYYIIVGGCY